MKKKVLSAVLVLCLILSLSACASSSKQQLLFRDVPIGSTYKEALPKWEESGIDIEKIEIKDGGNDYYLYYPPQFSGSNVKVNVAGYDMTIFATFMWESLDNRNLEDSILYTASYLGGDSFNTASSRDIACDTWYDDLYDKLTDLYGSPSSKDLLGKEHRYKLTWEGCFEDPQDKLELSIEPSESGNDHWASISITYFNHVLQLQNSIQNSELNKSPYKTDATNKDGL